MSNDLEGRFCYRHVNTPAVARCATCMRPICQECIVEEDGIQCCSQKCLALALQSRDNAATAMASKARVDHTSLIRSLIKWGILIAILAACFCYRKPLKRNIWDKHIAPLLHSTQQKVDNINQQNIEKDHIRRNQKWNDYEKESGVDQQ